MTDYKKICRDRKILYEDGELIWKEAQKKLLEEVRKDLLDMAIVNIDKYINEKLLSLN